MHGATLVGERFELLETAGTGGMGTVYRAVDHSTGSVVAVKVLRDSGAESIARFAHEARVLGELEHPHVVRYVTHGLLADGEPFLAMEWLDGQSLADRLKLGPMSSADTIEIGRRVAGALAVAHARGYVHRDIKPSNLFLQDGDVSRVKLLDFGIARLDRVTTALTKTGMLIGTPGYMAPEQAKGERGALNARADIFSLGCVLFECLTGQPAFQGMHVIALLAKLLMEEPPRVRELCPEVPSALDELISLMLSKEPELRPANGQAVVAAFDRLAVGEKSSGRSSLRPAAVDALTHTEKRLVSVVAVVPSAAEKVDESGVTKNSAPIPGKLLAEVRRAVQPFGAKIEEIANGMLIALLVGMGPATDQAAVAARCALHMRLLLPHSPIVLLTGRGESTGRLPIGEVFEKAASMLEVVKATTEAETLICIDDVTRALLDGRFDVVEEGGAIVLRAERDMGAEARTLLGKPSPFVGRDRELRNLLEFVDEALDEQRANAVVVTAEAGAGKSRLRYELLQRVRHAHPELALTMGRGDSIGAGSAFSLIASAFRTSLRIATDEPLALRKSKLLGLLERYFSGDDLWRVSGFLGEMIGVPFADDQDPRVRAAQQNPAIMADQIQRAYVDFVRAAVSAQPVLFVLEDLHWGDGSSIKLIDAALRELANKPFVVVAFARPEVHEVFPRLWVGRGAQTMALSGLARRSAETLAKNMLGEGVDAKTIATIVERAGGNAFYLEELIRAVSEGRGQMLPETILGMVESRIARLEPEARRILRAGSIFGETFWEGGARELLRDEGAGDAAVYLQQLCEQELIVRRSSSRFSSEAEYAFRHALVREGAYAMLTDRDRALGHALAGEWLERAGEQDPMVLAEHFERGGELAKAATFYAKASEQAMRGADFPTAIARAHKGLASEPSDEMKVHICGLLAIVYFMTAQYAQSYEFATSALQTADRNSSNYGRALGFCVAAGVFMGKFEVFSERVPQLLTFAPEPRDVAAIGQALYGVFISLLVAGQPDNAQTFLQRLKEISAPHRKTDLLATAWVLFSQLFADREIDNDLWSARENCRASALQFERAGAREFLAITNAHLGLSHMQLGLFAEADVLFEQVLATPDAGNLAFMYAAYYKSLLFVETKRFDDAWGIAGTLANNALAANDFVMLWCARLVMVEIAIARDKLDEAQGILNELGEANAFLPFLRAKWLSLRSEVCRCQGQIDEAVTRAADSVVVGASGPRYNYGEAPLLLRYALALRAQGNLDAANKAIAEARDDLLTCAAKIPDLTVREAYLKNIAHHAQTLQLAREWLGA